MQRVRCRHACAAIQISIHVCFAFAGESCLAPHGTPHGHLLGARRVRAESVAAPLGPGLQRGKHDHAEAREPSALESVSVCGLVRQACAAACWCSGVLASLMCPGPVLYSYVFLCVTLLELGETAAGLLTNVAVGTSENKTVAFVCFCIFGFFFNHTCSFAINANNESCIVLNVRVRVCLRASRARFLR